MGWVLVLYSFDLLWLGYWCVYSFDQWWLWVLVCVQFRPIVALGTGVCTVLTEGGLKCVSNIRVFAVWQAKLEDELPSETVSKVHLVDLAGR